MTQTINSVKAPPFIDLWRKEYSSINIRVDKVYRATNSNELYRFDLYKHLICRYIIDAVK